MELQGELLFPIQDDRNNICALQKTDGTLAQWTRYSAFGEEEGHSELGNGVWSPWRFANRREVVRVSISLLTASIVQS